MAEKASEKTPPSRRTLRKKGRAKRIAKLKESPEARKAHFEGKSKRSTEKKAAFRKKKKGKK
jgi:hypothetical protein